METDFALKVQASKDTALALNRVVTFTREDLTKTSAFVESISKISYTWYQTDSRVGIDIPYALENKDLLHIVFQEKRLTVDFPIQSDAFHIDLVLNSQIVPSGSQSIVHLNRIEIQMQKKHKNHLWPQLQQLSAAAVPQLQHIPQYPTSSIKKTDWEKIIKQFTAQAKKNKQDDEGANGLFKQIYANSDEETKRAMNKSLQQSQGTVLSTNWKQVKDKDYKGKDRPSPPKGQKRKTYG